MKEVTYKTSGVCARTIHFTRNDDGTITDVSCDGGCNGNLKAISKLVDGMKAAQRRNQDTVEHVAAGLEQEIWITK